MAASRAWTAYSSSYRAAEIDHLANWIQAGQSGAVIGLPGSGKSNLLGFLSGRPDVLPLAPQTRPVVLIPVDLNNLPAYDLATLYRVILRSFYEIRDRFNPALQPTLAALYQENRAERDPFLPQSALRELLLLFQSQQTRVVLILDRFDYFCQAATPPMLDTLRGLRDSFKDTLAYIVGLRHQVAYLADRTSLGELYELLDTHACWVGAMTEGDARQLVAQETGTAAPPGADEVIHLLALSGGYPGLLKAACHWWLACEEKPPLHAWADALMADPSIQHRLQELWDGLTQEEQAVLSEVHKAQTQADTRAETLAGQHGHVLKRLAAQGLCRGVETGWCVNGELLEAYVAGAAGRSRGKIWLDETTGDVYQGRTRLEGLEPLERSVLTFLVQHPGVRHTKTDLSINAWPDELRQGRGVSDESVYQVIAKLRRKIEPHPTRYHYLFTWQGKPEGGYQFFPEGRPG